MEMFGIKALASAAGSSLREAISAVSPHLTESAGRIVIACASVAVVGSVTIIYTVLFTDRQKDSADDGSAVLPPKTLGNTLSLYFRTYGIRYVGFLLNALVLPNAKQSATFYVPSQDGAAPDRAIRVLSWYPKGYAPSALPGMCSGAAVAGDGGAAAMPALPSPPVYIDLHGGGFVGGSGEDDSEYCRFLVEQVGCIVVAPDYALAPERPAPAAVNDAARVVAWARKQFGTDRIALGGFSAGGCIALSACAHPSVTGQLDALVAFYPPVDLSTTSDNTFNIKNPYLKAVYYEAYLQDVPPSGLADPLISPAYVPTSSFPPTCILIAAGLEPNKPDIQKLADRLAQAAGKAGSEGHAGPRNFITKLYPEPIFHGWTHVPEAVLRSVGVSRVRGGAGDGVECKWEAYNMVAKALKETWMERKTA